MSTDNSRLPCDITLDDLGINLNDFYSLKDDSFGKLNTKCNGVESVLDCDTRAVPDKWAISTAEAIPVQKKNQNIPLQGIVTNIEDLNKKRKKKEHNHKKDTLDGWFGLPRQHPTPLEKSEIMAIKLSGYSEKNRFMKKQDNEHVPKYFHFAKEVGGSSSLVVGDSRATPAANVFSKKKRTGRALLDEFLSSKTVGEFTEKKYQQVQKSATSGGKLYYRQKQKMRHSKYKSKDGDF